MNEPITLDAPLRAVRAFHQFIDGIPGQWRVGAPDCMKFRAIDDAGQVTRIRAEALEGFGKRVAKDSMVICAAVYCGRHHPAGVVVAAESWMSRYPTKEQNEAMVRDLGATPDLMIPENRELLKSKYGAQVSETLLIYGELRGHQPAYRSHRIENGELVASPIRYDTGEFKGIFTGLLDGRPNVLGGRVP